MRPWLGSALVVLIAVPVGVWFCLRESRSDGEDTVFETHSWGDGISRRSEGFIVNRAGQVRAFNFYAKDDHPPRPVLPESPTQADLTDYFGAVGEPEVLIPEAIMKEMLALIPAVSAGVLVCRSWAHDAGRETAHAWTRGDNGVYSRALLSEGGNTTCANTAPEASIVLALLDKYVGPRKRERRQRERGSVTPIIPVDRRHRCGESSVSVQAGDGRHHCALHSSRCAGIVSCECSGDDVCAGGRAHCRELGKEGLECVP